MSHIMIIKLKGDVSTKFEKRNMDLINESIKTVNDDFINKYNNSQSVNLLNYTLTFDSKFWTPNANDVSIDTTNKFYEVHDNFAGIHTNEDINFPLSKNDRYVFSADVTIEIDDTSKEYIGKDSNIFIGFWFLDTNIKFKDKNLPENRVYDIGFNAINSSDVYNKNNGGLPLFKTKRLYYIIDGKNERLKDVKSFNCLRVEPFYIGENGNMNTPKPFPKNTRVRVEHPMLTKGHIISNYYPNPEELLVESK